MKLQKKQRDKSKRRRNDCCSVGGDTPKHLTNLGENGIIKKVKTCK